MRLGRHYRRCSWAEALQTRTTEGTINRKRTFPDAMIARHGPAHQQVAASCRAQPCEHHLLLLLGPGLLRTIGSRTELGARKANLLPRAARQLLCMRKRSIAGSAPPVQAFETLGQQLLLVPGSRDLSKGAFSDPPCGGPLAAGT